MAEKIDKKNDDLFPFQTYTFRNTTELETMCPSAFDMMLNPEHEHELWIGNINGLVSPTSEYGLAIKLKGYIIAGKKLTFILPENYEAIRPDNGNIGFRKTVLEMIRLGESKGQITIYTYSIEHAEDDINKILKEISGAKMKFDVAIMNPPYDKNLHIDILNNVKKFVNNIVNISPIGKMQYALSFNTELPVKDMAIDRIPMDMANEIFQTIEIREDLGIWYNGKCSTNIIPHYNLVHKLITKLKTYKTELLSSKFEKNIGKFPVKFVYGATIAGHGGHGRACYRIISDNDSTAFSLKPTGHVRYINVSNYQEQKELQKIYNLLFLRFCYYIIERGNTPYKWLPVFDNTYTNKKFCLEFDITGYIDDDHAEPGSEWETILKTMEQYK